MEQTDCFETSSIKHHTPENIPKDYTQHSEHGESLKSRINCSMLSPNLIRYSIYNEYSFDLLPLYVHSPCNLPHFHRISGQQYPAFSLNSAVDVCSQYAQTEAAESESMTTSWLLSV
jgi:hypothetical protein